MRRLRDGAALLDAARGVLPHLPTGPLLLLSTSVEGTALAAVCATLRGSGSTTWARVNLVAPQLLDEARHTVFVEPVDPGAGWRSAIEKHYPGADFLSAAAHAEEADALVA